ncbi:zinc knuckle CX2CX4HX4C containing protein [Tanacetum coccineum]
MSTSPCKEELTRIPVWVKIHDVPIQVFSEDGISLIASQIDKPIMLDSFTSSMCIESWGQSSFARFFIEIKADEALEDSISMGIPLPEGVGFTKETVRVEYEWKPPRYEQCKIFGHVNDQFPKNEMTIPTAVMNNDGFQTVVNKKKSGKTCSTVVKTACASNIHTSNPFDALDDMESDEEVEVVFDETANLSDNNITRATYIAPDASKT